MYFVAGIIAGRVICLVVLRLIGVALVDEDELDKQAQLIADLKQVNADDPIYLATVRHFDDLRAMLRDRLPDTLALHGVEI